MTKAEVMETVKAMKDAPSCCEELKKIAEDYLENPGKEQAAALIREMKEDITTIDDLMREETGLERSRQLLWQSRQGNIRKKAENTASARPARMRQNCWKMRRTSEGERWKQRKLF